MGGYGAILLGMKHPDVFSVVYGMSSATLSWAADFSSGNPDFRSVLEVSRPGDFGSRYQAAIVCAAQAFSPNPARPPFYVDFPFRVENEQLVPNGAVFAAWEAKLPVLLAARYRDNLRRLRGIRFDAGTADEFAHIPIASRELSRVLDELEIPHVFEEYNGDHRNRLWGRQGRLYTEVLPWFSLLLDTDSATDGTNRLAPVTDPPQNSCSH
jgi:S-formylglutathione hydrolase FrmB